MESGKLKVPNLLIFLTNAKKINLDVTLFVCFINNRSFSFKLEINFISYYLFPLNMELPHYIGKLTPHNNRNSSSPRFYRFQHTPTKLSAISIEKAIQFKTFISRKPTPISESQFDKLTFKTFSTPCSSAVKTNVSLHNLQRMNTKSVSAFRVNTANSQQQAPKIGARAKSVISKRVVKPKIFTKSETTNMLLKIKTLAAGNGDKIKEEIKKIEDYLNSLQPKSKENFDTDLQQWKTMRAKKITDQIPKIPIPLMIKTKKQNSQKSVHSTYKGIKKQVIHESEEQKLKRIYENLDFNKDEHRRHIKRSIRTLSNSIHFVASLRNTLGKSNVPEEMKNPMLIFTKMPKKALESPDALNFMRAVKFGDFYKVKYLLRENRYLVYEYDSVGRTALHNAARKNYCDIMELLIENLADCNACDSCGRTPLYLASKFASVAAVKILLKNKASPFHATHAGKTPIDVARTDNIKSILNIALQSYKEMKDSGKDKYSKEAIWNYAVNFHFRVLNNDYYLENLE